MGVSKLSVEMASKDLDHVQDLMSLMKTKSDCLSRVCIQILRKADFSKLAWASTIIVNRKSNQSTMHHERFF